MEMKSIKHGFGHCPYCGWRKQAWSNISGKSYDLCPGCERRIRVIEEPTHYCRTCKHYSKDDMENCGEPNEEACAGYVSK